MAMYLKPWIVALAATLLGSGCSGPGPMLPSDDAIRIPYSEVADARERFIELFRNSSTALGPGRGTTDGELHDLLNAYHIATQVWPSQRDEVHFVVLDERGEPLNGVHIEVLGFEGVDARLEPTAKRSRIVVNGETRLRWTSRGPLELHLEKEGYRQIDVAFAPHHSVDKRRYASALYDLERGYLLPGKTPDGPVRIVMPPRVDWVPPVELESQDRPGEFLDPTLVSIPADAPLIVSSDDPREVTVPVRGTYVLLDGKRQVVGLVRLDRGNRLGLLALDDPSTRAHWIEVATPGHGSKLPFDARPYEWRLYSVAKPRTPTTQRSEADPYAVARVLAVVGAAPGAFKDRLKGT
jgi:hypothetical protein